MKGRFRIVDSVGRVVLSTLSSTDVEAFESGLDGVQVLYGGKVRLGRLVTPTGEVFFVSDDQDLVKSGRVFKSFLEILAGSLDYLRSEVASAEERAAARSRRLVHNLTSLNGHMIQEIYSVVPQERLAGNIKRNIPILAEDMRRGKAEEFARCFLSLAKHTAAMKNEFSVFKKINSFEVKIDKKEHSIHKVLMNVAYLFFSDFANQGSSLQVVESKLKAEIDYECAFVALYHLLDNSSKYVCPGTDVEVRIEWVEGDVRVTFDMCSLYFDLTEIPRLLEEGVSGVVPKRLGLNGDGVGLSLVKRVMDLHGGFFNIEVDPNSSFDRDGIKFQKNTFTLIFPK